MVLKLDLSKAYDKIEWSMKLGFGAKWITLVMTCVTMVTQSMLINGQSEEAFSLIEVSNKEILFLLI